MKLKKGFIICSIILSNSLWVIGKEHLVSSNAYECWDNELYYYYPNGVLNINVESPAYRIEKNSEGLYPMEYSEVAILCGEGKCVNKAYTFQHDFEIPPFIMYQGKYIPVVGVERAFASAHSEHITMTDRIAYIGGASFSSLKNAKSLNVSAGLNNLAGGSFDSNSVLEDIYFRSFVPPVCHVCLRTPDFNDPHVPKEYYYLHPGNNHPVNLAEETFPFRGTAATIYVPKGCIPIYSAHPCFQYNELREYEPEYLCFQSNVSEFNQDLEFCSIGNFEVAVISGSGESVVIPELITSDQYEYGTDMSLHPYRVTSIAPAAMKGNKNLVNLILPNSIEFISSQAFEGTSIESIILPDKVKYIDSRAFAKLEHLKEVVITTHLEKEALIYVAEDVFAEIPDDVVLYVDTNKFPIDINVAPWNSFKEVRDINEFSGSIEKN
ncbi:MAG: leucine-rich repeat domain-containing protein [Muribaculaceae bacterium]|nr:leucine-rich repeat domain-containing protein [Muribaculaceae bacterium]